MSKKKENIKTEEEVKMDEGARIEAERRKAIAEFNVQHMGEYWIDPDRVPTQDDIDAIKKEFEDRTKALNEKKDYVVADKENALRVAKFMQEFNNKSVWQGRMFVGVLRFNAEIQKFIDDWDENNPVDLVLEYGPTQYAFLMFDKYAGTGIEDAQRMADIWDEYLPIYEKLYELVEWYKKEAEMCSKIKERWAMFEQGYYMHIMDPDKPNVPEEEKTKTDDGEQASIEDVDEQSP